MEYNLNTFDFLVGILDSLFDTGYITQKEWALHYQNLIETFNEKMENDKCAQ